MTVNGNEIYSIYLCSAHYVFMKIYSICDCFENLRSKLHKKRKEKKKNLVKHSSLLSHCLLS